MLGDLFGMPQRKMWKMNEHDCSAILPQTSNLARCCVKSVGLSQSIIWIKKHNICAIQCVLHVLQPALPEGRMRYLLPKELGIAIPNWQTLQSRHRPRSEARQRIRYISI